MASVTTKDGTNTFNKDWGPKDGWDAQFLFCLAKGYRVVAHGKARFAQQLFWHAAPAHLPR